mmetsp:Transcript_23050/g.34927  ORF Transcript_23050/g.34927 Transcript_23050/m.34927 type:complete len:83 (-) Transcript_23050:60-308(-)
MVPFDSLFLNHSTLLKHGQRTVLVALRFHSQPNVAGKDHLDTAATHNEIGMVMYTQKCRVILERLSEKTQLRPGWSLSIVFS